ncbi:hypothetical protein HA466_0262370 [Hirschfeldia incana]|nr:hypothetical protein HA466_0262370 [Hirschfeldia incana]
MNRSMEEDYGTSPEEGFKKGEKATQEHYKAILLMVKDQMEAKDLRHSTQLEVDSISAKMELLEDFEKESFDFKAEKEKLETKLLLAEEELSKVKVPYIDWDKLGEAYMSH